MGQYGRVVFYRKRQFFYLCPNKIPYFCNVEWSAPIVGGSVNTIND